MQNYEKLRQLLCEEEEIYEDMYTKENGQVYAYNVIELRHILWYMDIKVYKFNKELLSSKNGEVALRKWEKNIDYIGFCRIIDNSLINFSLPPSLLKMRYANQYIII